MNQKPYDLELNEKFAKAGLSQATVDLLFRYFDAFANLYEIINFDDAFRIIDKQNPDLITFEQLYEFSDLIDREQQYYHIIDIDEMYDDIESTPKNREIVAEHLLSVDDEYYYTMKEMQQGKPIYVPSKEELLKYEDELYYEKTPYAVKLEKFFKNKGIHGEELIDLMFEMVLSVVFDDEGIEDAFDSAAMFGIDLSDNDIDRFGNLYCDFSNNSRMPSNRGYTPKELGKLFPNADAPVEIIIGDNTKELLRSGKLSSMEYLSGIIESDLPSATKADLFRQVAQITGNMSEAKTISKNALCPCGSGKKYKRCCGKDVK